MVLGTPHRPSSAPSPDSTLSPRPTDVVLGFQPSQYQRAIFDWLSRGEGSCVVSAVPGSGKTTTLLKGTNYLPSHLRSRFLAFNRHIAEELSNRLPRHIKASTIHSLGLASICRRYRGMPNIDNRKYSQLVDRYLADKNVNYESQERRGLIELIKFTQLTLTDPPNQQALKTLIHHYNLYQFRDLDFVENAVYQILERGIQQASHRISYSDMIWLPCILDLTVNSYDFLCIDEAQDLNRAQLQIVLKAHAQGARGIYVGDAHQAIMGFCAADHRSIETIISTTNAMRLPLSICYRCPTSHIELANKIYPVIEPRHGAPVGTITEIGKSEIPKLVKERDLIVCRCFYPLIKTYFDLLCAGIKAKVRNKDIIPQLFSLLEQIVGEGENDYSPSEFTDILTDWYTQRKKEMMEDEVEMMIIVGLHDRIQTLNAIYVGSQCVNTGELREAIANLSGESKNAVNLTTIHGAKGLEANRVFHLRPDLVPHPRATKDWEKTQENNLEFVALTRARTDLFLAKG
jgi:DNA helicase-2/ATP-dependent DNA helicase PcrA